MAAHLLFYFRLILLKSLKSRKDVRRKLSSERIVLSLSRVRMGTNCRPRTSNSSAHATEKEGGKKKLCQQVIDKQKEKERKKKKIKKREKGHGEGQEEGKLDVDEEWKRWKEEEEGKN